MDSLGKDHYKPISIIVMSAKGFVSSAQVCLFGKGSTQSYCQSGPDVFKFVQCRQNSNPKFLKIYVFVWEVLLSTYMLLYVSKLVLGLGDELNIDKVYI